MKNRVIFSVAFALVLVGSGCAVQKPPVSPNGATIGNFHFDSDISPEHISLLRTDFARLDSAFTSDSSKSADMLALMKLTDTSPVQMRGWLEARVQYVVAENYDKKNTSYDVFPELANSKVVTIMD